MLSAPLPPKNLSYFSPLSKSGELGDLIHTRRYNANGTVMIYICLSHFFTGACFHLAQAELAGLAQSFILPVTQIKALSANGQYEVCTQFTASINNELFLRLPWTRMW